MARKRGNVITISGIRGMSKGAKMAVGAVITAGAIGFGYWLYKDYQKKQAAVGFLGPGEVPQGSPFDYNERFKRQFYQRQRQLLHQRSGV